MGRLASVLAVICLGCLAIGTASASAATEFGSSCTATKSEDLSDLTLIQLKENGVATTAPVSGVVTKWKTTLPPTLSSVPTQLKVFRPTGSPSEFMVVGESAEENTGPGLNVFETRIPIGAGDLLGLHGASEAGTLFCKTEDESDAAGAFAGNVPAGSSGVILKEASKALIPVLAAIEPDADGDGYGDETQDGCPSNASVQTACPLPPAPLVAPPVLLDTFPIVLKRSVLVLVDTSAVAPVTVTGSVKLKKGSASLSAAPITVAPGQFGKVVLRFPAKLKRELRNLPSGRKLSLTITASAPNSSGAVGTDTAKVNIRGQARKVSHRGKRQRRW